MKKNRCSGFGSINSNSKYDYEFGCIYNEEVEEGGGYMA